MSNEVAQSAFNPFAPGPLAEVRAGLADERRSGCPVPVIAPGLGFVSRLSIVREALLKHAELSNAGNFVIEASDDGPAPPALITQSDPP